MKRSFFAGLLACSVFLNPVLAHALEVDKEVTPRILLGGRVIATSYYETREVNNGETAAIDTSDSSFLLGFDKPLFRGGFGGATLGLANTHEGVKFHQLNAFLWGQNARASIGQMRLRNTLIEMPVLRDDDLLEYTHVLNGEFNHQVTTLTNEQKFDEFIQLYGNTVALDWFFDKKIQSIGIWSSERGGHGDFNTVGFGYQYTQAETLRYVKWLRHAGLLFDAQQVADHDAWLYAVIAGAELNLNMNPESNWALMLQGIQNTGSLSDGNLDSYFNYAKHDSVGFVMGLRYTARPLLLTRWHAGLSVAYKDYVDVSDATQLSIIPNFFYRLGQGIELAGQLSYTNYAAGIREGDNVVRIQLGLIFSLDAKFNDNIGERDSILNIEHGYVN